MALSSETASAVTLATTFIPGLVTATVSRSPLNLFSADLINRYADRFLFGTDEVAPQNQEQYLRVYYQYQPLWKLLDEKTREKVLKGNYERIFDGARHKVRAWETAQGFTPPENPQ